MTSQLNNNNNNSDSRRGSHSDSGSVSHSSSRSGSTDLNANRMADMRRIMASDSGRPNTQPNSIMPIWPQSAPSGIPTEARLGSNAPLNNQAAPSQQAAGQPNSPPRPLTGNNFQNNHSIGGQTGPVLRAPQAYHYANGNTYLDPIQHLNQYCPIAQVVPPYSHQQATPPALAPGFRQTTYMPQHVHQFPSSLTPTHSYPNYPQPWPLTINAPEDKNIQSLGYEDAIILVHARWENHPKSTPIKNIIKEECDELSARSKSTKAQKCRIDRSTGPLSPEHEHLCPEKRIIHSPTHVNTVWSQRDHYTLASLNELFQLSDEELLKLIDEKANLVLKQRIKDKKPCGHCDLVKDRILKGTASPPESSSPSSIVNRAVATTKILVGGIPPYATRLDILKLFQPSGLPLNLKFGPIKKITRLEECAFVEFRDRRHAEEAINKMQGYPLDAGGNMRLRLSWGRQQGK